MTKEKHASQLNINPGYELLERLNIWAIAEAISTPELSRRLLANCVEQQFQQCPELDIAYQAMQKSRATRIEQSQEPTTEI